MSDDDKLKPEEEADAVLGGIKKPDTDRDPAKEIEERGAPDGIDFA